MAPVFLILIGLGIALVASLLGRFLTPNSRLVTVIPVIGFAILGFVFIVAGVVTSVLNV